MARPKREDINDVNRRNDLVIAAAVLFKEKGYHGTTMRDIARATNMQAGSPFYHFASKQDLLFAGVEESLLACLAELEAIDPQALPALDYFRALARVHLGRLLDTQSSVVPMVADEWRYLEGEQLESILAIRNRFEALWLAAFVRLKDAGRTRRADAMACRFFLTALIGTVRWYNPGGPLTPEQIADELVSCTLCRATGDGA
ncbi:TetR/AcrR family transcriptional regulator [Cupriavidus sp. CV2]|uniref:TetR/AcrR family transcriptional regulator n=1 Tax=Cupriavidus ulmosensis TaxID=3065913 RepID=UPI00296ABF3D|nr:TetR/AcrR family transcriptional regulator [Cupriavidus sp. CV2]MDW3687343.1 TetR/AcrR family transcriptional regulator [Cupriavidus sp. CV2]